MLGWLSGTKLEPLFHRIGLQIDSSKINQLLSLQVEMGVLVRILFPVQVEWIQLIEIHSAL